MRSASVQKFASATPGRMTRTCSSTARIELYASPSWKVDRRDEESSSCHLTGSTYVSARLDKSRRSDSPCLGAVSLRTWLVATNRSCDGMRRSVQWKLRSKHARGLQAEEETETASSARQCLLKQTHFIALRRSRILSGFSNVDWIVLIIFTRLRCTVQKHLSRFRLCLDLDLPHYSARVRLPPMHMA